MKKIYSLVFSLLLINSLSAQSVTKTVYFDCQYNATTFPSASPWNNFYYNADQDFYDSTSALAGHIKLTGWVQGNSSGTPSPTAPAVNDFPTNVQTQDNIYSQGAGVTSTILITGLNSSRVYTFTIFCSRAGVSDNRETLYTISGLNSGNAALNASSNTGNVAIISNIQPDATGTLTFTAQAGPNNNNSSKYFYLACMKMVEYDLSTGINNDIEVSKKIHYVNNVIYTDNLEGTARVFNTSGIKVAEEKINNNKFSVNLRTGIYIVSIGNINQKIAVK